MKFDIHVHGDHVSLTSEESSTWNDEVPAYVVSAKVVTWGVPSKLPPNHPNNLGKPAEFDILAVHKYDGEKYEYFVNRKSLEYGEIEKAVDDAIQNESLRRFDA